MNHVGKDCLQNVAGRKRGVAELANFVGVAELANFLGVAVSAMIVYLFLE